MANDANANAPNGASEQAGQDYRVKRPQAVQLDRALSRSALG